ncbi:hypothetical protein [uncultured Enterovirga sp.]|uniref:hypothetical protein n=1 Tax=uncultured Enterovirga sp. TaxID=2026352 RepID=UPI0035CA2A21
MAEPDNLMLVHFRELRAELSRQDKLREDLAKKQIDMGRALTGETLMARYAVTDVDERLQAIEARLARLEGDRT